MNNNGNGHHLAHINDRSVLEAVCPHCPLVTDITGLYRRLEILDRAKSDFIQIASHELRTPLALIKGYTEVMDSSCRQLEDDVTTLSLRGILSGVSRLEELVNTMLCASQVSHGQLIIQPRPCSKMPFSSGRKRWPNVSCGWTWSARTPPPGMW